MPYRTLNAFEALFGGRFFNHRVHTNGDTVSINVFEDVLATGSSPKFANRVAQGLLVANVANTIAGVDARRPDGTLGYRVQHVTPTDVVGFTVKRGRTVSTQVGIEVKILSKAMIRQIGRVKTDLRHGCNDIRSSNKDAIAIGIIGINHAPYYVSREGKVEWRTTGKGKYLHPYQEADKVEPNIRSALGSLYDELLFLHFKATNEPPFPFEWVNPDQTKLLGGSMIGRVAQMYEQRF